MPILYSAAIGGGLDPLTLLLVTLSMTLHTSAARSQFLDKPVSGYTDRDARMGLAAVRRPESAVSSGNCLAQGAHVQPVLAT